MKTLALGCMLLLAVFASAQHNLTTNLQACYDLNCTTGTVIPNGASTGAALDGTVHGNISCVVGHLGIPSTAIQFGGTPTDYVQLPHSPLIRPTTSITIAGWFYVINSPYQTLIFAKNSCTGIEPGYTISSNNGKFGLTKYPPACGTGTMVNSITTTMNAWHYVVAYADNSRLSIGIDNGTPVTISHTVVFSYDPSAFVYLGGANVTNSSYPFDGRMDNVRFYNRELTPAEISTLYTHEAYCTDEGLAPVTGFNIPTSIVCDKELITCADQSTNTPIAWNWQFEGGAPATSTIKTPTVTYSAPGVYTVSLATTNNYGAGTTAVKTITVTTCAGVSSYAHPEQRPEIFPNPAAGKFTIDRVLDCDVSISDLSGRLMDVIHTNSDRVEINCSSQSPGVYSVAVRHRSTGALTVLKLVVYSSQ